MPIYTKTGDDGTTSLFGGRRVKKSDAQVEAYGTIDELTSFVGMAIAKINDAEDKDFLTLIQKNLYRIMAVLAGAKNDLSFLDDETKKMEKIIDNYEKSLPVLNHFVLPQGGEIASWLHIVRAVCRRAERAVVRYSHSLKTENSLQIENCKLKIVQYLNRLSDLFFVMARQYGQGREQRA